MDQTANFVVNVIKNCHYSFLFLLLLSLCQFRAWLRTSYRPGPFKDQEQVSALLVCYAEQQAQERRRRGDQDWMNQASGVYSLPYSRCNR